MSDVPDEPRLERYCVLMHDAYEDAAHENGWASQVGAIPWAEVPEANKATMRVAVGALLAEVAAERQRLHDHVEADALAVLDKYDITLTHGSWREILTELTALVSPVSDDTGRTLCPKCKGKRTVPPVSPGLPVLCSRCTGMGTVPVSDDTGGTKP